MSDPLGRLIWQRGPDAGKVFLLDQVQTTIGRGGESDLVFDDPEISRRHAQVRWQDGRFVLEDLGSTNGTFLNGRRLSGIVALQDGDVMVLSDNISLAFQQATAGAWPPADPVVRDQKPQATVVEPGPAAPPGAVTDPSLMAYGASQEPFVQPQAPERRRGLRLIIGCGCALFLLALVCGATLFFLDSFQSGRLLYCGPVRPLFEVVLGPLGFAPVCP